MQRRTCKLAPLAVDVNKKTISLTIKSNSFDEFLPYNKPGLKIFVRTSGCSSFVLSHIDDNKRDIRRYWVFFSFEILFLQDNLGNWCRSQQSPHFIHVDESDSRGQ